MVTNQNQGHKKRSEKSGHFSGSEITLNRQQMSDGIQYLLHHGNIRAKK